MPLDPNCWFVAAKLVGTPPPSTPYDTFCFVTAMVLFMGVGGSILLLAEIIEE